jgi:hypothetical protein
MRRSILTVLGLLAIALAVPSAALAHHGRGHHHHKAKGHHQAKLRFMHIGANGTSLTGSPTSTAPTAPTTPTTTPTTPPPENAGKVTSYTGGVLTLTLNDGSTVSGKVTEDTRIGCVKATPTTPPSGTPGSDQGPGDDNGQGDDQSRGDTNQQGDQGSGEWQGDHGNGSDDDEEVQGTPEPPCDSSALVAGAVVRAAELRIGPSGNEFESILLVR